jgi:hypothetical protein
VGWQKIHRKLTLIRMISVDIKRSKFIFHIIMPHCSLFWPRVYRIYFSIDNFRGYPKKMIYVSCMSVSQFEYWSLQL